MNEHINAGSQYFVRERGIHGSDVADARNIATLLDRPGLLAGDTWQRDSLCDLSAIEGVDSARKGGIHNGYADMAQTAQAIVDRSARKRGIHGRLTRRAHMEPHQRPTRRERGYIAVGCVCTPRVSPR